jgi:hypothetical protein
MQTFASEHIPLRYSDTIKLKSITLFQSFIFFLLTPLLRILFL